MVDRPRVRVVLAYTAATLVVLGAAVLLALFVWAHYRYPDRAALAWGWAVALVAAGLAMRGALWLAWLVVEALAEHWLRPRPPLAPRAGCPLTPNRPVRVPPPRVPPERP